VKPSGPDRRVTRAGHPQSVDRPARRVRRELEVTPAVLEHPPRRLQTEAVEVMTAATTAVVAAAMRATVPT
jgi:hypothetical protein